MPIPRIETKRDRARRPPRPSEYAYALLRSCPGSARRQCIAESLAYMRPMQARIVAILRSPGRNLQVGEHRSCFGQHGADLLLEHAEVGEIIHDAVSGRAGKTGEVDLVAARNRVPAIGLIGAVLED